MNKTVYQVMGASLTFPESKQTLNWVEETLAKKATTIQNFMLLSGYTKNSQETSAMVQAARIQTLGAIAKTKPSLFKFKTNDIGEELLTLSL